jgi:three-Cys-motif partner protein
MERLPLFDDGLPVEDVGTWAEEKHLLVSLYASLFARAMRRRWSLSYLDLYAGPGRCRFRDSGRLALTSPTRILGLADRFDRYLFCEQDPARAAALEQRVARDHTDRDIAVLVGDANDMAIRMAARIPVQGTLGFCFLDPYRMANLRFSTIQVLARRRMDFLVLIPSGMDTNRNERNYVRPDSTVIEQFCGARDWRDRWQAQKQTGQTFEHFIVTEFGQAMGRLGYLDLGPEKTHIVRMDEKNVLLYRLAFYSRHALGAKFWAETRKYATPQTDFGFQ